VQRASQQNLDTYVSLGGAVANDVHGKSHHRAGTFGQYVLAFELLRSDGTRHRRRNRQRARRRLTPAFWRVVMGLIGVAPERLFKRLKL